MTRQPHSHVSARFGKTRVRALLAGTLSLLALVCTGRAPSGAAATSPAPQADCVFNITPSNRSFQAGGGAGTVTVNASGPLCPRTAASNVPWISITSGASDVGDGVVTFTVAPTNTSREGTINVAGRTFTVWQERSPCAAPGFTAPAPRFPAGPVPRIVAQADFNNDGRPDVAALGQDPFATPAARKVSVVLASAAGGFEAPRTFDLGGEPTSLAAADFNHDGKADVVATVHAGSDNVRVFLGDGAGNLATPAAFNAGSVATSVAVGDFNADGKRDLAVSNSVSHNVSILLGTGTGSFGPPTEVGGEGSTPLTEARRVVVGDFNADGKQDLFVVGLFMMWRILGNGDGTFTDIARLFNPTELNAVVVGDFNRDGRDDLAGTTVGGEFRPVLTVFLGDGAGGFGPPVHTEIGHRNPSSFVVADFNGDGKPDLGAASGDGGRGLGATGGAVNVFLGDGAGSFTPGPAYVTGVGARDLVAADFDLDGKLDIAAADSDFDIGGSLTLLKGTGGGAFVGVRAVPAPFGTAEIAHVDFDGDGRADLFTLGGSAYYMPPRAPGEFGHPVLAAREVFPRGPFSTADFNRDGRPDLGVHTFGRLDPPLPHDNVKVLLNDGTGALTLASDTNLGDFNNDGVFADFNEDGVPDYVSRSSASLVLSIGDGAGGFAGASFISPPLPDPARPRVGDFNGDGHADLVTGGSGCGGGQLTILSGDGAGNFSAPASAPLAVGLSVRDMKAQDLNGDGLSDLVVINDCNGNLLVLTAEAAGGFRAGPEFAAAGRPQELALGDLSGDGKPDLVVSGEEGDTNLATVFVGDGAGGFSAPATFLTGQTATSLVVADFDEDGRADLAFNDREQQHVALFFNTCPVAETTAVQFAAPAFAATEGTDRTVLVNVTRTGDTTGTTLVNYATADGTASERKDYGAGAGRLRFAPGETSKTFEVVINDDAFAEGAETFTLSLGQPLGAALGATPNAAVTINSDDAADGPSPVKDASFDTEFFVRQHYADFLNREPDAGGLQFWVDNIESCGANQQCREVRKVDTSAAFFLSIEFQETGFLAYRAHRAAFGDLAGKPVPVRLRDFLADTRQLGDGLVVGMPGWPQLLEANKQAYFDDFVGRAAFASLYPQTMGAEQFVGALFAKSGVVPTGAERQAALDAYGAGGTTGRAAALRSVAESQTLRQAEFNEAFVLMQYFGYLRRNPDDPQDTNFDGYNFWLQKLEQFDGNFVGAEMVKAFISSIEYGDRFGL